MKAKYKKIWQLALPYLEKGVIKDFVLHTQGVVKAMDLLLKKEKADPDLLIPAAILHDAGWAKVPKKYQQTKNKVDRKKGMILHIKYIPVIAEEILSKLDYKKSDINKIIDIAQDHKNKNPRSLNKKLLIDADQLSDTFREQLHSDAKSYGRTPLSMLEYRMNRNEFYTKTAKIIFKKQTDLRLKELK